ncbi:MAG TPA: hypothetical protein VGA03_07290 [Anaerolineales bacterium]
MSPRGESTALRLPPWSYRLDGEVYDFDLMQLLLPIVVVVVARRVVQRTWIVIGGIQSLEQKIALAIDAKRKEFAIDLELSL